MSNFAGWLGLAYPVATLIVIVGTANHFILDAVGGVAVILIGFIVQWLLSARGAFTPPTDAPDFGMPDPPLPHSPLPRLQQKPRTDQARQERQPGA